MTHNPVRARLAAGDTVANAWVSSDSLYAAEVLSHVGYDAVTVDCQHGMFDLGGAIGLLQAISAGPATGMARVASLDPPAIGKLLDAGAWGIICPSIDTPAQGREFVAACRYPPVGRRSYGPARGLLVGGPDYPDRANDDVMAWAMVESRRSLDNLDAILAVDGLDGIYVGPNDLALSLGEAPGGHPSPVVMDALAHIADSARRAQRLAGVFCGHLALGEALIDMGYTFITPGNDVQWLRKSAQEHLRSVRRLS